MARYAILSDIHANLEALEAVLEDASRQQVDEIWYLGDLVVYGPNPNECIARLREAVGAAKWPGTAVIGNNDQAILEGREPEALTDLLVRADELSAQAQTYRDATTECHIWTAQTITDENLALLREIEAGPRNVLHNSVLVHASPCDPIGMNGNYLTNTMEAEEAFWCLEARGNQYCLFGHTHLTTVFRELRTDRPYQNCEILQREQLTGQRIPLDGNRLLINPGSTGQPRDGDNRAAYIILDTGDSHVEFHRVDYQRQRTLQKLSELINYNTQEEWKAAKEKQGLSKETVQALQSRLNEAR